MSDPFLITGPAVIGSSGGRSSMYLLRRVIQAHGGTLPGDVVPCFVNTGREMPATLDFVAECEAAWNVRIRWLEFTYEAGVAGFREVSHNSASRNGEPLEALFRSKPMLPNPVARFCTIEGKIRTQKRFLRAEFGWDHWTSVVGLRADEPKRVERALDRERTKKDRWHNACPLSEAGIQEWDVLQFWRAQPFNLRLKGPWEGNCDGCFLKGRASLERMFLDHPERMAWWATQEATPRGPGAGGMFRADRENYASMARTVRDQRRLPFDPEEVEIPCVDAGCGV